MADNFLVPSYRLPSVQGQGASPYLNIEAGPGAFGAIGAAQLQRAGAQLQQTSDNVWQIGKVEMAEANRTRVDELNNQYLEEQTKILSTGQGAYYTKQGSDAINGAESTMKALQDLRKNILAQPMSRAAQADLAERLSHHVNDASGGIGRHVANQSLVWRDQVAKGTVAAGTNQMTSHYNDPEKVALHAQGIWQTEYDRAIKQLGDTPEGRVSAKASADGARSDALSKTITLAAVSDPNYARRLLDKYRGDISAADAVSLEATVKDATLKRRTQDIVTMVTATGGVSPNYNARTSVAEGGSTQTENKIGALGKYQMIPGTYTEFAQQTEWGKGKSQAEVRQMLLDPKEGPARQEELQNLYNQRSIEKLRAAGVRVNDLTLYTTHFLGHAAGPEILKLPDDTPLRPGLVQAHGGDEAFVNKVYESNPFLAKVNTVGDLKALLAQKIAAPLTMANTATPEKPNLDAMLANGLQMAGSDPDLRERVTSAIKTDFATRSAIYNAQIARYEREAFAHIDAGGTLETLPTQVRAALDSDSLVKVQQYEEKKTEKRRKENADAAYKDLTELERLGQLTVEEVVARRTQLPDKEYRAWIRRSVGGEDRMDDPQTYERLQRGLGTQDMRDAIFTAYNAGDLSKSSLDSLLGKNDTFLKTTAPASPYKIEHDRITRSLDPGLMGSGISREIYGRAVKSLDQYVLENPQRDAETPEQYRKRLSDFTEDTIKRFQLIKTGEMAVATPVPANTPFDRSTMSTQPKEAAQKQIARAMQDLMKKAGEGSITQDQLDQDTLVLMQWKRFVDERPEPQKGK